MTDISILARSNNKPAASPGESRTAVPMPARKWRTRVALPAVILLAIGGLIAYGARDALLPTIDVQVLPVVVKSSSDVGATMVGGSVTVQAPGWVEADPFYTYVGALTDGILDEVLVLEGQPVKKGQVVARMNAAEAKLTLERAEAELRHHSEEVKAAEARLVAAQATWDNPTERTRAVAASEAALAEAKAELAKIAKEVVAEESREEELAAEYQRTQRLVKSGAVTELEEIRAKKRLAAQAAMVEATKAREPVQQAKIRQLEAEVKAAQENLRLRIEETKELAEMKVALQVAHNLVAEARVDRDMAALRLDRMNVTSPVDGVVMSRIKRPGDALMFSSNMPDATQILRVYDPKALQVRVDVPLSEAAQVGVGMKAQVIVGVLPDKVFEGEVTRVVHEADIQKNTLQVKVRIINPTPEVKPEMLTRVKFLSDGKVMANANGADSHSQRVFAPEHLIRKNGPHGAAWVVDQGKSIATERHVMTGHAKKDGWVEVTEGLKPGDLLVATSVEKMREGQKVRITGEASK